MKQFGMVILMLVVAVTSSVAVDPWDAPVHRPDGRLDERWRILGDLNGDGREDIALSVGCHLFGNAGGRFDIYLADTDGRLQLYDSLFLHPQAVAVEKMDNSVRLWAYHRGGGRIGEIGYYEFGKDGFAKFRSLTIHPGDNGTQLGNAMYQAVFQNSNIPLRIERSQTVEGKVTWVKASKIPPSMMR